MQYSETKIPVSDKILAAVLGIIVVVMFMQVTFRYVFNNSIAWSEELVRYLFVWITFFGAAICFRDKLNIGVDFFLDLMPERIRNKMDQINVVIMILFTVFLLVSGIVWMVIGGKSIGSSIPIPINWALYGAIPFSCLWTLYFLGKRLFSKSDNSRAQ